MSSSGTAGPGQLGYTLPNPGDIFTRQLQIQEIRNAANQNALFNQTFQAKQLAGQIMSQAPDVETGIRQIQQNPQTAAFAADLIGQYRQLELTNQQVLGAQQEQYGHAFTALTRALPSAYTDIGSFQKAMQTQLGTLPDSTRQWLIDHGVVTNLQKALFDGLPQDPAQAKQAYAMRLNALMLGADFTPAQIEQSMGKTENVDTGGGTILGNRAPVAAGGGFTPTGTVTKTLPPTAENVGGVPYVIGGGQAGTYSPLNPFTQASPQAPASSNALGATPPGQAPASAQAPALPRPQGVNYGDPTRNPTGFPLLNPAQQEESEGLSKTFGDTEKKAYDNAQSTLGSLDVMDRDLDELAGGPSQWLRPGFAGKARTTLANLANTVAGITGNQPIVPPEKLAAAESYIKSTRQMGIQVLTTMLGNQREAAQTISNITEAVPSIDNTFLGGKLLVNLISQQSQKVIDQRQYEQQYLAQNGTLIGATEAFNSSHPASQYMAKAFNAMGMKPDGTFQSPQAVFGLVKNGSLTQDQAVRILEKQFPGGPKKHLAQPPASAPVATPNALGATP